jgi:hypothetical protein
MDTLIDNPQRLNCGIYLLQTRVNDLMASFGPSDVFIPSKECPKAPPNLGVGTSYSLKP